MSTTEESAGDPDEKIAPDDFEVPDATVAFGIFGPAPGAAKRRSELTPAQVEDRKAIGAALKVKGFPDSVPRSFSTAEQSHKR